MTPRESGRVDFRQWRALLRAHALTDYSTLLGHDGPAAALRAAARMLLFFVAGGLMNLGAAAIVWLATDVFLAASVMTGLTMFVVAMLVVSSAVSLVGPDDFAIVGFRPISSQTYFAARASALAFGALELALPIGWLPVVACFAREGGSFTVAAAATAAIAASSCVVTLALAAALGLLMRVVPPKKLTRAILTAQTLGFLALFTAYWMPFVRRSGTLASVVSATLPSTPAVLLFPGTWFGSYVAMAAGHTSSVIRQAAALSIAAMIASVWGIVGPLSSRYVIAIGEHSSEPSAARSISLTRFGRFRAERRAVLILLASQLRANLNVQASLLSGVMMAVMMGGVFFIQNADSAGFALLIGSLNVRDAFLRSSEHEAVWPFVTTPCRRALVVITARDAIAVCVIGPLLLLLTVAHLAAGSGVHAFVHIAAAGLGSYLTLQLAVLGNPALPCSLPMMGRQTRLLLNFGAMIGGGVVVFAIRFALYSRIGILLVVLGTVISSIAVNQATDWRIRQLERRQRYA